MAGFKKGFCTHCKGDERARLALDNYNYLVAQYIGKYAVTLQGIDAIVFTAGIGENQINIRKRICEHLEWMGVKLNLDANNTRGEDIEISTPDSKVKVWVVPTNEELVIARDTKQRGATLIISHRDSSIDIKQIPLTSIEK